MFTDDLTTMTTLKNLLEGVEFILGTDGLVYAQFVRDARQVTYPLTSSEFMTWFRGEAAPQFPKLPSAKVMSQVIKEKEHDARLEDLGCPVATRIFADEDAVVVELGNGATLAIDASGATKD